MGKLGEDGWIRNADGTVPIGRDDDGTIHRCVQAAVTPSSETRMIVIAACGVRLDSFSLQNGTAIQLLAAQMRGHLCSKCFPNGGKI